MNDRLPFAADQAELRAAGGVVWRRHDGALQVLLVHRPHRSDWSIPKGRVDPGETLEQTARREVLEETGLDCDLGQPLGHISYWDHKQRSKSVWYWAMEASAGEPVVNDEVDEFAWLGVAEALRRLDYETDRDVLERFVQIIEGSDS